MPLGRSRALGEEMPSPRRPIEQFAPAIGAALVEVFGAIGAKGAFEAANEGAGILCRQIHAAAFAIGAHFKHGGVLPAKWSRQKGEASSVT